MYCVIYKFEVKSDALNKFVEAWHQVSLELISRMGSLGARLHKSQENTLIAYAQWPDQESWQNGHEFIEQQTALLKLDNCMLADPEVLYKMELMLDLLVKE